MKRKKLSVVKYIRVCKLFKGVDPKNDLIDAIKVFKEAYLKESLNKHTDGAFSNFINSSVNLYDMDSSESNRNYCKENFKLAINFYKKNNIL